MYRWQIFEDYLTDLLERQDEFNHDDIKADLGVSGPEASYLVQAYLGAQRGKRPKTAYVIHRTGRTSAAVWKIGVRADDAREVTGQAMGDFRHRIEQAVKPDLIQIGQRNPRALRLAERALDVMVSQFETTVAVLLASNAIDDSPVEVAA